MHPAIEVMRPIFAVLACMAISIGTHASPAGSPQHRTEQLIRSDAQAAARHAISELRANGMQGLIDDVRKCYDITALPAFKCVYLDIAAWHIDKDTGAALGTNGPTHDYFDTQTMNARIAPQMVAQGFDEATARKQMGYTVNLMESAVEMEWAIQNLANP